MNKSIYFQQIDDYLSGKLKGVKKTTFEKAAEQDKKLAKELRIHKLELEGMKIIVEDNMRKRMSEMKIDWESIEKEQDISIPVEAKKSRILKFLYPLSIAASFLILLGIGFNYWNTPIEAKELASQNFHAIASSKGSADIDDLSKLISEKRYKEVITRLEAEIDNLSPQFQTILGEAYFREGQYKKAISTYKTLLDNGLPNKNMKDAAQWNLLMCYIASEDKQSQDSTLQQIISEDQHEFYYPAKEIQSELR